MGVVEDKIEMLVINILGVEAYSVVVPNTMLEGEDMLFTEVSDIVVVDENDDVLAILDGIEEEYMGYSILVYEVGVVEDEVDVLVITVVLLLLYSCALGKEA